jgi:hypothetical protein
MLKTLNEIFDWSEVWALFIPIIVLFFRPKQPRYLRPVIVYLLIALLLNLTADIIQDFKAHFPEWIQSNNPLYNIHSLVRFACFSYFFRLSGKNFQNSFDRLLGFISLLLIIFNFILIEPFFNPEHLSGNLLATEAFVLLIYCMQYYLNRLKLEADEKTDRKDFLVVTGLSIYVVINFFVFLFYVPMLMENPHLANNMWDIHNLAYIILCIFIAKAFYEPA